MGIEFMAAQRIIEVRALSIDTEADWGAQGMYGLGDTVPPGYASIRLAYGRLRFAFNQCHDAVEVARVRAFLLMMTAFISSAASVRCSFPSTEIQDPSTEIQDSSMFRLNGSLRSCQTRSACGSGPNPFEMRLRVRLVLENYCNKEVKLHKCLGDIMAERGDLNSRYGCQYAVFRVRCFDHSAPLRDAKVVGRPVKLRTVGRLA
jgi:hypothetical protein